MGERRTLSSEEMINAGMAALVVLIRNGVPMVFDQEDLAVTAGLSVTIENGIVRFEVVEQRH